MLQNAASDHLAISGIKILFLITVKQLPFMLLNAAPDLALRQAQRPGEKGQLPAPSGW